MTEFGPMSFNLDWYQIPSLRNNDDPKKMQKSLTMQQSSYNQILVSWAKYEEEERGVCGISQIQENDLFNYFSKIGSVINIVMHQAQNKAILTFSNCIDAEAAVDLKNIQICGQGVQVRQFLEKRGPPTTRSVRGVIVIIGLAKCMSQGEMQNYFEDYGKVVQIEVKEARNVKPRLYSLEDLDEMAAGEHEQEE